MFLSSSFKTKTPNGQENHHLNLKIKEYLNVFTKMLLHVSLLF